MTSRHGSSEKTRLVGKSLPCDACGETKSKGARVPRTSEDDEKAKDVIERRIVEISGLSLLTENK